MTYAPDAYGARCSECPLRTVREGIPVPPSTRQSAAITVVVQCPGRQEVDQGKPLVGPLGVEVNRALQAMGMSRSQVNLNNAVACMPPNGDYRAFVKKLEADNKKRDKQGLPKRPMPHECCAPRLRHELEADGTEGVIPIGAVAAHTLLGGNTSIMKLRGQLIEHDGLMVVPTVANILYRRRYRRVFVQDIARAIRWFTGKLPWTPPTMTFIPHVSEEQPHAAPFPSLWHEEDALRRIKAFLEVPRDIWCSDVETVARYYNDEGKPKFDPLHDVLRCIGFGDRNDVMTVGVTSVRKTVSEPLGMALWSPQGERALAHLVIGALNDGRLLVGHNFGSYDKLCFRTWARKHKLPEPTFTGLFDTLMGVRVVEPELEKGLGFCATVYMDEGTPAWKADHTATEAGTDYELWHYNGLDVAINARLAVPLAKRVHERQQERVLAIDHKMQAVTVGLHEQGLLVDQQSRQEWSNKLQSEMQQRRQEISSVLQRAGIHPSSFGKANDPYNPGSPYHVREVLFDHFDLPPPSTLRPKELFTETGERSTGKAVFNAYLADPMTPPIVMDYLEAQRRWKKADKLHGTYIKKADPRHPKTVIDPVTGRVHAEWKAHATLVGRMACAAPNLLNQPKKLRNMYRAQEGHCFSGDTEVLTPIGWIRFDQLIDSDGQVRPEYKTRQIAQWSEDGTVEFVQPLDYMCFEDRELLHFKSHNLVDFQVTPEHRCIYRTQNGAGPLYETPAAQYLAKSRVSIHAGRMAGPSVALEYNQLRLVVAMQADGHWSKQAARFEFAATSRKVGRLERLLTRLGITATRAEHPARSARRKPTVTFYLAKADVAWLWNVLGPDKLFPWEWLRQLTMRQRDVVLDAVSHWDGGRQGSSARASTYYDNTNERNIDFIQALAVTSGRMSTKSLVRPGNERHAARWRTSVRADEQCSLNSVQMQKMDGLHTVYCVRVPSTYLLVRRRGRVIVSGNCFVGADW